MTFHNDKIVTARKVHRCSECRADIGAGERYLYGAGLYEGDFYTYKLCTLCDQAWRWTHRQFSPDPEWCAVGDLATLIQDCAETFGQLRVAAYLRRQWRNQVTGDLYDFPEALL